MKAKAMLQYWQRIEHSIQVSTTILSSFLTSMLGLDNNRLKNNAFRLHWLLLVSLLTACQSSGSVEEIRAKKQIQEALISAEEEMIRIQEASKERAQQAQQAQALKQAVMGEIQSTISQSLQNTFDISVSDMPAKEFFLSLVVDTDENIILHNDISGAITISLKSVTIDQVMDAVEAVYGFNINKESYGFHVYPFELSTQVYNLNYLDVKRTGVSATSVNSGEITSSGSESSGASSRGSRIETTSETDFWEELNAIISTVLGDKEGRSVVINAQSGIVVVRASPKEQKSIKSFLEIAERNLNRQVIIEAKILEVELNESYQTGINWGLFTTGASSLTAGVIKDSLVTTSSSDNLSVSGDQINSVNGVEGIFSAAFDFTQFKGIIELLSTQGEVQVMSSPRISTVNNQKAVIKVGTDEFFVTEFTNNTTTAGDDVVNSPEFTLTPFFSGIALDVTPQIGDSNNIVLHIHPSVTEVRDQEKVIELFQDSVTLPLALSTIRESDSIVRAESGQIIVIGGLLKTQNQEDSSETPWFADMPFIGKAFKQKKTSGKKSELVILLKPVVATPPDWLDFLPKAGGFLSSQSKQLDQASVERN